MHQLHQLIRVPKKHITSTARQFYRLLRTVSAAKKKHVDSDVWHQCFFGLQLVNFDPIDLETRIFNNMSLNEIIAMVPTINTV